MIRTAITKVKALFKINFGCHKLRYFLKFPAQSCGPSVHNVKAKFQRVNILAKSAPWGGGNKFNSRKNREEIQFQTKSKKLTIFMSFMDIFPMFDEFLPYFSSYLSHLMFSHNFIPIEQFSALGAIWGFILPNFV